MIHTKPCTAFLLALLLAHSPLLRAADPSSALAPNDWRQLWSKAAYDAWQNKPESELEQLAEGGHPTAQFVLWQRWHRTQPKKARAMLDAAAKSALPQAMLEKGSFLFEEHALPQGWALMEKAAATGYLPAKISVAEYDAGFLTISAPAIEKQRLLKPNLSRALEYFREAAKAGYPRCMRYLALLYSSGIGEPRDQSESPHNLLLAAAARRDREAMVRLSERYLYGHGEKVDLLEAARWQYLSCQAQDSVGRSLLVDGHGDAKAQDTAAMDQLAKLLSLFIKAAEFNSAEAATALARRYAEAGKLPEAVALFRLAERRGSATAGAELKKIEPTLTPEQAVRARSQILLPFAH